MERRGYFQIDYVQIDYFNVFCTCLYSVHLYYMHRNIYYTSNYIYIYNLWQQNCAKNMLIEDTKKYMTIGQSEI